jgi:hypothetical protein
MRQPPRTTPEAARPNAIPPIEFPEALPVSARRDDIAAALRYHQAIVVCGETGSGKTTQLPKIALAMGRGRVRGGGLIGHTQPRRIAASSVARRIAEELKTPLGEVVGFKVRCQDRLAGGASVKLMTDGIPSPRPRRPAASRLRHHHRRRGARAQPQHRFPARPPAPDPAAPARPEGHRHLGDDRRRALRQSLRGQERWRRCCRSRVGSTR